MMPTFQAPLFAWLLPLAALPVIFHLFFRVRARRRTFPSLMFFLAADPRLGARRKLREWLILALRCLALAAALLALARPVWQGLGADGETTLVIVVDNSASMAAVGRDGPSRLSRALAGAQALIEDRGVRLAGAVATVRDPGAALPEGLTADRTALRVGLAALRPTHATGAPLRALASALGLLRGGQRAGVEIHLFSDLQAAEWDRPAAPVNLPPGTVLCVHDVGRDDDASGEVALLGVQPPARPPLAGRAWSAEVTLRNAGGQVADVSLDAGIEGASEQQRQALTLPGGARRSVTVRFRGQPAGLARARFALDGAGAAPGSEAWLALAVEPAAEAWLLGGEALHGLLGAAWAPAGPGVLTGLAVVDVSESEAAVRLAREKPALLAATAAQLADPAVAAAIREWVAAGGVLVVAPGRERLPQPAALPAALPAWCGARWGTAGQSEDGTPLVVVSPAAGVWQDLRTAQGDVGLPGVSCTCWVGLTPEPGTTVLAAVAERTAVLTEARIGAGAVFVSGLAWDPAWSTLPQRAAFLALAQGFARARGGSADAARLVAGQALPLGSEAAADGALVCVRAVAGEGGAWQGPAGTVASPVRAGVFELQAGGSPPRLLAVRGDDAEAPAARVRARTIPLLAGTPHRVVSYVNATATVAAARAARAGRSLFGALLLLAVGALLAESWLVNRTPAVAARPGARPGEGTPR